MAFLVSVLRTKAEKFERKEMLKFNFNLEEMSGLDSILQGVYVATRPKHGDYEVRKDLIRVFNEIAKEIYGAYNEAPVVEEFGSFSMDLFTTRSDLDMSINFINKRLQITREKKIHTLRKFAKKFYVLQSKGHVTGVHPITTAKVPILKVVDRGTGVECDLSVENRDGILKSRLIHMFCSIDERFQKLSFLMKTWAKAQNINSSKDGTLNSLSIILLVAFHLQTRKPPILPPFTALLKDGTDPASVLKLVDQFVNYGKNNKESVAELFVTLLIKLSSIERLWSKGLCASVCEASWKSKTWNSKVASISIEDFTDQSQNVARAVGAAEMKLIYKSIQYSMGHVFAFISDHIEGSKLQELLFGQDFKLPQTATGSAKLTANTTHPSSVSQVIHTDKFGQNAVTPMNAKFSPYVAQPCVGHLTETRGVQISGREENLEVMNSNSLQTKRLLPVDGWGRWPSAACQQMEKTMPLANTYTEGWTGMQSCSWERLTSTNMLVNAQQPMNELELAYPYDCDKNQGSSPPPRGWKRPQQAISFPSTSGSRNRGSAWPRFHSVDNNQGGFHKSSFPVSWRARLSKKRRRF